MDISPEEYNDVLEELFNLCYAEGPLTENATKLDSMAYFRDWLDSQSEDWKFEVSQIYFDRMFKE